MSHSAVSQRANQNSKARRSPVMIGDKDRGVDDLNLFDVECRALSGQPKESGPPEETLCGLAFSGGGIRSATFNLGVLQALDENKLLGGFDYLATVSGGGYIGGFWTAWRRAQPAAEAQPPMPTANKSGSLPEANSDHIKHLRMFSNFLRPRLPLISFETGRLVATVVSTIVPSLAATTGVLALVLLWWLGVMWLIMDTPQPVAAGLLAFLLFIGHLLLWRLWRTASPDAPPTVQDDRFVLLSLLFYQASAVGVATVVWWLGWWLIPLPAATRIAPTTMDRLAHGHWGAALLLPAAILVGSALLVAIRAVSSRSVRTVAKRRQWHGTLDTALAASLYMAAGAAILGLLWVAGPWLAADGVAGVMTALSVSGLGGGAFAWLRSLIDRQPNKPEAGKVSATAGPWLLQMLAYLVIAAAMLAVAGLLSTLFGSFGIAGLVFAAGGAMVLCLLPLLFDPETVGLHHFYRSRLSRAYLGAATAINATSTEELDDDDFPLDEAPTSRPLHLVCCAANDLAGDPIPSLHRGADSAVLSGHGIQVGEHWAQWSETHPAPSFGSAMTASAAAFNSHMGAKSMRLGQAVTFLMTALNLRLGLWVDNPKYANKRKLGDRRSAGRLWLPTFYREMFGQSNLFAPQAFLSDGAHYDNLALYELVRRGCRFIVLSDCGADPDYAFDDLGNAIRRIRTDLGVEIDIDTKPLVPNEDGKSPQSIVAGDIQYGNNERGVLLLIKPSLQGNEPADVRQYAGRSPDFPQQTTADQFYDEAQWEAYRKLGEHIVGGLLERLSSVSPQTNEPGDKLRWTLAQSLQGLLPPTELASATRHRLEQDWQALESRLAEDPNATLLADQVLRAGVPRLTSRRAQGNDPPLGKDSEPVDVVGGPVRLIKQALHLMESVNDAYRLNSKRPPMEYIGWTNRLGRWASAPLFRAWWPWLAPLHTRNLVDFIESAFKLGPVRQSLGVVRPFQSGDAGYALDHWRAKGQKLRTGKRIHHLGYFVDLPELGGIMMAMVSVHLDGTTEHCPISWRSADFFNPAGLWGVGLAEQFLEALMLYLEDELGRSDIQIKVERSGPSHVSEIALYSDPRIELVP